MIIQRILANNPGPFTGPGTNTWLVDDGEGTVVVVDPGPVDHGHAGRIVHALEDRDVAGVLVTHTHADHAPLANPLAKDLGVPAVGYDFGPQFDPDLQLTDGSLFKVGQLELQVIHTPGHASDHLCFRAEDALFTGDHIMGGSSVMVEDMGPYLRSLEKLRGIGLNRFHPGHGDEMDDPDTVIDWYLAHRLQRHEQIYESVVAGNRTVDEIVVAVYSDVDASLHPLAARSVAAHLTLLSDERRIALEGGVAVALPEHS